MLYRPKFCSECGEKIQRADWSLTTSRQHCEICAPEFPYTNWVPRISIVLCGILVLVGAKFAFFPVSTGDTEPVQTIASPAPSKKVMQLQAKPVVADPETTGGTTSSPAASNASDPVTKRVDKTGALSSQVFYCGAPTKKGTPCSRRVKVKGYCWQHSKTAE